MGRPKKKLTDDSVKVRYKTLADGRKSVYLDCCDGGKRTYDFLKLYLLPETDYEAVRKNKATMKKVEELQRERTLQLMGIGNGCIGDKPESHTDMLLSEWMNAYIDEVCSINKISQNEIHEGQYLTIPYYSSIAIAGK